MHKVFLSIAFAFSISQAQSTVQISDQSQDMQQSLNIQSDNIITDQSKQSNIQSLNSQYANTVTFQLSQSNPLQFYGVLIFGSNYAKGQMIFDTRAGGLSITSVNCTTCRSQIYNPRNSIYSSAQTSLINTYYQGNVEMTGYIYQDEICMNSQCVYNQNFIAINSEYPLLEADGIIGLAPNSTFIRSMSSSYSNYISSNIASFMLGTIGQNSYVMFGGYEEDDINSKIHWYATSNSNEWSIYLKETKYGKTQLSYDIYAVFDTSTYFIGIPSQYINSILMQIPLYISTNSEGMYYFFGTCSDYSGQFSTFYFQASDNKEYSISPDIYLIDGSKISNNYQNQCIIGFVSGQNFNQFVLGQVFLQRYYFILDYDKMQIGLALSTNSKKLSTGAIVGIVLGSIAFVAIIIVVCCCIKKRKERKRRQAEELAQQQQYQVQVNQMNNNIGNQQQVYVGQVVMVNEGTRLV